MDKEIVHSVLDRMGDILNVKVIGGAVIGLVTYKYSLTGDGHIVGDYASGKRTFHHRDM